MDLISLVIVLVVVGVLLWAVNQYVPMDPKIKNILNIVVVIAVVLWLLQAFGLFNHMHAIHVGSPVSMIPPPTELVLGAAA